MGSFLPTAPTKSRACGCFKHEECDGWFNIMYQDGNEKTLCECQCHVRKSNCKNCGMGIQSVDVLKRWIHSRSRKTQCMLSAEPVEVTDEADGAPERGG